MLWNKEAFWRALGKLSVMWEDGVYLGVKGKSGEIMVGNATGVWKTRTVQRKPLDERWDSGNLELVRFVPWRVSADDPDMDGELPTAIKLDEQGEKS